MTSPRTLLGPLTTTWAPGGVCSYAVLRCDTCTTAWQAQTCNSASDAHDWTGCWPPAASTVTSDPGVMMGWGIYSPGIYCPVGYTTAALATAGGKTDDGWGIEYSLSDGETAAACCPKNFGITYISVTNTYGQTCVSTATDATFSTVVCSNGQLTDYGLVHVPNTVKGSVFNTYTVYAPLYQINWQPSDLPSSSSTQSSSSSSSSGASNPGSSVTNSSPSQTAVDNNGGSNSSNSSGGSSGSGLSTGAKIGIGVGSGVAALLILALLAALIITRRRHRVARPPADADGAAAVDGKGKDAAGAAGLSAAEKKRRRDTTLELGGEEVRELDGKAIGPQEMPTRVPTHKVPGPNGGQPFFRVSDQAWVVPGPGDDPDDLVAPVAPHGQAVFELEGSSGRPSIDGTASPTGSVPASPMAPGARPMTGPTAGVRPGEATRPAAAQRTSLLGPRGGEAAQGGGAPRSRDGEVRQSQEAPRSRDGVVRQSREAPRSRDGEAPRIED